MKVLHINTSDTQGGAARAAGRIHRALLSKGVDSKIMVTRKQSRDPHVLFHHTRFKKQKRYFTAKIGGLQVTSNPTYRSLNLFPSGIHRAINRSSADIVNLHWIGDELISIAELKKIRKPIVWTLHDMWVFCGAEHCDDINSPGRYKQNYASKNRPAGHGGWLDIDAWTWNRKKKHWKDIEIHFVTPSKWLEGCLQESSLFYNHKASIIPNCIDVTVFKPGNKKNAREVLNLSQNKKFILFGADDGAANPLKGFHHLEQALRCIDLTSQDMALECLVFGGNTTSQNRTNQGIPVTEIGSINDDNMLALLYRAADVFVTPSVVEAFGQTVLEAMSCGTPCVGFDIGGISDLIDHQRTGILVTPFDCKEFAEAIEWILSDDNRCENLGEQGRKKVTSQYDQAIIARQYIELYEQVLDPAQSTWQQQ